VYLDTCFVVENDKKTEENRKGIYFDRLLKI